MSLISTWSTIADANGTLGSPPFYWPEGQAPSTVNDCARLMMASIRTQFNELPWFNWGYNVTRASGTSIQITTASANTMTIAAVFYTGGRLKFFDTTTLYGTITTVSASAVATTVSFTPDSGSLTASFSSVSNSVLNDPTGSGLSIPADVVRQSGAQIYGSDGGATDAYAVTMSPVVTSLTTGQVINFHANTANTGNATLAVDGLAAINILKNKDQTLITGDIKAGQLVTVIYDGTNFQMQSQLGGASGGLVSMQFFTSGTGATYTRPAGVSKILVECVGGGGGGGGCDAAAANNSAASGGGGGGYCRKWFSAADATYTYSVGAGGAGGAAGNNNGVAGGDTTFSTMTASGGIFGTGYATFPIASGYNVLNNGAPGGGASGGDVNTPGGYSGIGIAGGVNVSIGGYGGDSYIGAGAQSAIAYNGSTDAAGGDGTAYGAGGGGAATCNTATTQAGGNGAAGLIIVWEYA